MPSSKRWIDFNEENLKELPTNFGVFQFADEQEGFGRWQAFSVLQRDTE